MVSFQEALAQGAKRNLCNFLSNADAYYTVFQNILPQSPLLQLPSFPGALYGVFCNRDPESAPTSPPPPFTGGQCDCAIYQINYTWEQWVSPGVSQPRPQSFARVYGPITSIQTRSPGNNINGDPGFQFFTATCKGSAFFSCGSPGTQVNLLASAGRDIRSATIVSVDPFGGSPNNCGDPESPPPNLLPPGENQTEDDIEFTDDNDVNVTVPVIFIYGTANINVKGEVIIPVDVQIGPNTLELNLNFNTGDVNIGPSFPTNNPGNGSGGRGTNCECDDRPIVEDDDDEPDNGVPEPTELEDKESDERVIIGAIVTVTNDSNEIGEVNGDPYNAPDIAVPRFGDLMFEVRIGGRTAWLNDIPVKLARVYIPCPWEGGALRVVGIPKPGVVWTINPVYSTVKQPRNTTV